MRAQDAHQSTRAQGSFTSSAQKISWRLLSHNSWRARAARTPQAVQRITPRSPHFGYKSHISSQSIRLTRGLKARPRSIPEYEGQHPLPRTQNAPTQASYIPALHGLPCIHSLAPQTPPPRHASRTTQTYHQIRVQCAASQLTTSWRSRRGLPRQAPSQ
jgi:hypothetical protein